MRNVGREVLLCGVVDVIARDRRDCSRRHERRTQREAGHRARGSATVPEERAMRRPADRQTLGHDAHFVGASAGHHVTRDHPGDDDLRGEDKDIVALCTGMVRVRSSYAFHREFERPLSRWRGQSRLGRPFPSVAARDRQFSPKPVPLATAAPKATDRVRATAAGRPGPLGLARPSRGAIGSVNARDPTVSDRRPIRMVASTLPITSASPMSRPMEQRPRPIVPRGSLAAADDEGDLCCSGCQVLGTGKRPS